MSLELYIIMIGVLSFILSGARIEKAIFVYNVKDYGAVADGQTDDSEVDFHVYFVTNATIRNISSIDSKFFHIHIFKSRNITFNSIIISAPGDSPNTDGIHIADSTDIYVGNSIIGTGDDCISIGPGCINLTIFNVLCGPGHGISIGSLGKDVGEKDVIGLKVKKCNLTSSTNGLRIKTWQSSLSEDPSLVKITDIKYRNITGTYVSQVAYKLVCSEAAPCEGVELSDISLEYNGDYDQDINATSICVNVYGSSNGNVEPEPCI
ncbi:hypothetical protein BHE74_00036863 [Ensete ventricosum]|nr:hypothetical protein BHE74_00036863 [Ensete ventricosum]RZS21542.1 hypothetical protein BHM03_00054194 [Ensete ventricosum]